MSDHFDDMGERMRASALGVESVDPTVLRAEPCVHAGQRPVTVTIEQPEFTSLCPMTGLPDFGVVTIQYVPGERIVELKSLKYYLMQYRQVGVFYEHVVVAILDHLVELLEPRSMTVAMRFTPRGGLTTSVEASHPQPV
jgi:7-cyano-7-deazaguanine reductase